MAEEKKQLTDAQKQILSKVISKDDSSTFTLCVNEEQEAQLDNWRSIKRQLKGKQVAPDQMEDLNKVKDTVLAIYKTSVYCPYCGKLAEVTGDVDLLDKDKVSFSCSCEGATKEKEEKENIKKTKEELDTKFFDLQVAATNAAIKTYKEHYKDVIEFRKKAFAKLDEDIMSAPEL